MSNKNLHHYDLFPKHLAICPIENDNTYELKSILIDNTRTSNYENKLEIEILFLNFIKHINCKFIYIFIKSSFK